MEIIINNQQAVLKEGTSFDFIAENRLFTGSDSYTLTITFPLRGCAQNIAIFGHIHRADVAKNKVVFDCEIRDRDFYRSGTITITEISDVEVKTQFLEVSWVNLVQINTIPIPFAIAIQQVLALKPLLCITASSAITSIVSR